MRYQQGMYISPPPSLPCLCTPISHHFLQGKNGVDGHKGEPGTIGEQGPAGVPGPDGEKGAQGKSVSGCMHNT